MHPTSGLWRPVPRYEDRPKLAERGEPESHAASDTVCFPDSPRTLPGSRSKMAEGGRSRSTHPRGCHSFSKRGCAPAHFTFQCWQRLSESNAHDPRGSSSGSGRLSTSHASLWIWWRADHSKAMPLYGTHRLATACRTPPASLSRVGARLRTCTSPLPLTRRAHRWLCVTGNLVGRAGIAPASLRLKGGSLSR